MNNSEENPSCKHIKSDGVQCGSPCMAEFDYCYHHLRYKRKNKVTDPDYEMPVLEDADSVQLLISDVILALLKSDIDQKKASTILYAAQIASSNLARLDNVGQYIDDDDSCEEDDDGNPILAKLFLETFAEMKAETD